MTNGSSTSKKAGKRKPEKLSFTQDFIPIKNLDHGTIETADGRYIKILEVEPINFMLRSAEEQYAIISSFASWLKISPVHLQFKSITRKADSDKHIAMLRKEMETEESEQCKKLSEGYIRLIKDVGSREALTRRFFLIFRYEELRRNENSDYGQICSTLLTAEQNARAYFMQCGNNILQPKDPDEATAEILYMFFNRRSCVEEPFHSRVDRIVLDTMAAKNKVIGIDPVPHIRMAHFIAPRGIDLTHRNYIIMDGLYVYTDTHDADDLRALITGFKPAEYGYPVDGVIMEYDDLVYGKSLGATGHHENRLMALKWEDELYETECTGLDAAVTRTGMVSLTATFKPVEIEGTMVSRAYVHNLTIFQNLALGVGDKLMVYKANKIIPQIAENRTQSGGLEPPNTCPCCGSTFTIHTMPRGSQQLFCENPSCAAKLVQKFDHFCEKTRMNIEGLSATTLEKFIGHGWIRNFGDLYTLAQHREDIIRTAGFGVKSYERLQESVEKSRHCTLAKFIAGLGIPMVGRHAGRDLGRYFGGSWEAFESAIQSGFDFTKLPNFGETMHNNIYKWYADTAEAELWRPLLDKIIFEKETVNMSANMDNPFFGKTVVATGKLEHYTRDGIQMKLLELGAKPGSSVSKNTDYLIVGEKAGSKLAKAQQLGVKTLTEQEFEDMLAE